MWWAASGLHTRCPWPALLGCSDSRRLVDHAPQRRCDRSARRSNLRSRRALRVCPRQPYLESLSAPRGNCMRCCSATCAMAAQTGAGAAGSCPVQSELLVHAVAQGWTKQVGTCFSRRRPASRNCAMRRLLTPSSIRHTATNNRERCLALITSQSLQGDTVEWMQRCRPDAPIVLYPQHVACRRIAWGIGV